MTIHCYKLPNVKHDTFAMHELEIYVRFHCSDIGARFERDAFDTLFDHAPDKLNVVKKVR